MKSRTIQSLFAGLILFVVSVAALQAQSNSAPPRLAILAIDPVLGDANDVLTAAFSKRQGVVLLERAQIQKVYREQQLSAANQDLIKLGQVLGADGLAILQTVTEGTNQFLQSRLIAAKLGVVLAELRSPWPLNNLLQWSDFVADDFSPLLPKLTVLAKDALPLSILNLRSPLQNAANQELERELTVLLIHRLTHEPDVVVLERQHLSDVLAEKELAADDSPFWTSRYLLDGIIDKEGFNPLTATVSARLAPAQGGEPVSIEVSGPRTNLNALAESLVAQVLTALHRSSTAAEWKPAREADQFFDEGQWAYRWRLLPQAAAAAESAWALGRRDKAAAELRIRAYCDQNPAHGSIDPSQIASLTTFDRGFLNGVFDFTTRPLPAAIRAQELFCQDWPLGFTNRSVPDAHWYDLGLGVVRAGATALEFYCHNVELRPGHEEELAQLRSLVRQTASILETNDARPFDRIEIDLFEPSIRSLEWQAGGYWVEKPEDALKLFRRMMVNGFHPTKLPVLAGWSWQDRRRLPKVLKQWLGEVCGDTNLSIRFEGQLLSILRAPDDGSGRRQELEQEFLAALWSNRRWILNNTNNLWPLQELVGEVVETIGPVPVFYETDPFDFGRCAATEHRMEMDYLANPSIANEGVFAEIFESWRGGFHSTGFREFKGDSGSAGDKGGHFNLTLSNATELLPLMEKFSQLG
jgi:hypothetical protein